MQFIHGLTDSQLHSSTLHAASEERRASLLVLRHFREVEARRLYAKRGHSSMFEYVTRELGYSEGAAYRRIASARLMKEIPEVEDKVESGLLKLHQLAQVQSVARAEKRETGMTVSAEKKKEWIAQIEGKSSRETERTLSLLAPRAALALAKLDRERPIGEDGVRIEFTANKKLMAKLERVRQLAAYRVGFKASHAELLEWMADEVLKKLEKDRPSEKAAALPALEARKVRASKNPRYIPTYVRREVWARDQGICRYRDPGTGNRCRSRLGLQIDHVVPVASGGRGSAENLQLLCVAHHQLKSDPPDKKKGSLPMETPLKVRNQFV
jgi:hypothetical protein